MVILATLLLLHGASLVGKTSESINNSIKFGVLINEMLVLSRTALSLENFQQHS
jgi:hypothetical protein